jgi:hypothetical protein
MRIQQEKNQFPKECSLDRSQTVEETPGSRKRRLFSQNKTGQPFIKALTNKEKNSVLEFLGRRPLHTVNLVGLINDNGLESPLNRGCFYSYCDENGKYEGVALIGHATLMESSSSRSLAAFAGLAQDYIGKQFILGEQEQIKEFWNYYAAIGQPMRLLCQERLHQMELSALQYNPMPDLRPARPADLSHIVTVQAQMAFEESGLNPLDIDAEGFKRRCLRRIELGRSWVLFKKNKLIFKAEVMATTPKVTYLEGIWVSPEERGQGYGLRSLTQLCKNLSHQTNSYCLFINEARQKTEMFYQKVGFEFQAIYSTIYLHKNRGMTH